MAALATSRPAAVLSTGRVLIVDDSAVARAVMARMIDASDRLMVAGSVANVAAALAFLDRQAVELIVLDLQMPGVDGLTALPDLLVAGAGARVLVVSSSAAQGAAATVQALALGAADTLEKPGQAAPTARFAEQLVEKLGRLLDPASAAASAVATATFPREPVARVAAQTAGDDFDIVAIGASTGGIHALNGVLRALPSSFRLPVLITQHLPAAFMPYFAAQLATVAGRPCDVAEDRMRIRPGRIVIAPGDAHMRAVRLSDGTGAIRLAADPSSSGCLPSVDPMFASLAAAFGDRLLAIVLSGMGRDGAEGARHVHAAGGTLIVQDQASSVIWGMPGAVAAMGIADAIMEPEAIGRLTLAGRRPC